MTGTDLAIGMLLADRFRVSGLIGRGGMATVYRADDEALGRTVALKVIRGDLADGEDLQRQQDEIQLLATLNHPGLVTLFDAATDAEGQAFLVMELVEGTDLHTRLRDGILPADEVARIGHSLAEALVYVHAQGVVHRDIKPGNILLPATDAPLPGQHAKLADFGIARIVDGARLTATGKVLGTASYFSPEQALGEPLTPASDVYSLGLVLLESLTGERAFGGTAVESMTARLARDPEVPAELGDSWAGLLRGMTQRMPDARPTARDVSGALARLARSDEKTEAIQPADAATRPYTAANVPAAEAPPAQATPRRWRRPVLIAAAAAVVLLLLWPASLAVSALFPGAEPAPSVEYPVVDGTLGTHLEQLQRSVQP
jgi:serine/threonine protein kinase